MKKVANHTTTSFSKEPLVSSGNVDYKRSVGFTVFWDLTSCSLVEFSPNGSEELTAFIFRKE
jgi:hypothetical protein